METKKIVFIVSRLRTFMQIQKKENSMSIYFMYQRFNHNHFNIYMYVCTARSLDGQAEEFS